MSCQWSFDHHCGGKAQRLVYLILSVFSTKRNSNRLGDDVTIANRKLYETTVLDVNMHSVDTQLNLLIQYLGTKLTHITELEIKDHSDKALPKLILA